MRLILSVMFALLSIAQGAEKTPSSNLVTSPDCKYVVRFRSRGVAGNRSYDRADLVVQRGAGESVFQIIPRGKSGKYDDSRVIWSSNSRLVAVYSCDRRGGAPQVVEIVSGGVRPCKFPEIRLSDLEKPEYAGLHRQDWLKPIRWTAKRTLLCYEIGQLSRRDGGILSCDYEIVLKFDAEGKGSLRRIKRTDIMESNNWNNWELSHQR